MEKGKNHVYPSTSQMNKVNVKCMLKIKSNPGSFNQQVNLIKFYEISLVFIFFPSALDHQVSINIV